MGLEVTRDPEDGVLLEQALQRGRDLVVVTAGLRFDGERGGRLRKGDPGKTTRAALSARVSPVWVSLSLATAPMSPAWTSAIKVGCLPCIRVRLPSRSATSRDALCTVESDFSMPEYTRRSEIRPA